MAQVTGKFHHHLVPQMGQHTLRVATGKQNNGFILTSYTLESSPSLYVWFRCWGCPSHWPCTARLIKPARPWDCDLLLPYAQETCFISGDPKSYIIWNLKILLPGRKFLPPSTSSLFWSLCHTTNKEGISPPHLRKQGHHWLTPSSSHVPYVVTLITKHCWDMSDQENLSRMAQDQRVGWGFEFMHNSIVRHLFSL